MTLDLSTAEGWLDGKYVFAASSSQRQLWFVRELDAAGALAYHMPVALRIPGPVDRVAMQRALHWLVARHEALRTRVARVAGDVMQAVSPEVLVALDEIDVAALPREACDAAIDAEARRPFHYREDSLLRATLFRLADGAHALLIVVHHLVCDGASLELVVRELFAAYGAFTAGHAPSLLPPALQYADYVAWQEGWLASEACAAQRAHWVARLAGAPLVLDLARGRARRLEDAFRGASHELVLPAHVTDAARRAAAQHRVSLYSVLLAAFALVLHRRSGQDDLLIGMPVANRRRAELDGVVGCFANTVVARVQLAGDPKTSALLRQIAATVVDALEHQELPFDQVVEALQPARSLTRNPVFQVMFGYHEIAASPVARMPLRAPTSRFDLTLFATDDGTQLAIALEYNAALLDAATIAQVADQYRAALIELAGGDVRASDVSLLAPAARAAVLARAFRAEPQPESFVHAFERIAANAASRIALSIDGREVRYGELDRRANRLAHALVARGAGPERRIAVRCARSERLVIALLAVLKTGAAYVPIDPALPEARQRALLADAQPTLLLDDNELDSDDETPLHLPPIAPASAAYLLYTSGSTGQPKGVVVTRGGLDNFLASMARGPGIAATDTLAAITTISFDIAALELLLPLTVGARVVLVDRDTARDPRGLLAVLEREAVTVMQATPATWRMLIDTGWRPGPALRVLCGGEALAQDLADALTSRGAALWNLYGPTETTVWSCRKRLLPGADVTIGEAIGNTGAYVLDRRLQPVPSGVCGELYLSGEGVARGYWQQPALTAEAFVPDPFARVPGGRLYRTGDLAVLRSDGEVEYVGRRDSQVKIRGFRVELGEIDAALRSCEGVRDAATVAVGVAGSARLISYVVGDGGEAIQRQLRARLPDYMVPAAVIAVARLPTLPSGKLDRAALAQRAPVLAEPGVAGRGSAAAGAADAAPSTELEVRIAAIWSRVLDVGAVGLHDNFFALGGTSLQAARLAQDIHRELRVEIAMRELYLDATVDNLARIVERGLRGARAERAESEVPLVGLTADQRRLRTLLALDPALPATRRAAYAIEGAVDVAVLQQAIGEVVARHAVLRDAVADGAGATIAGHVLRMHTGARDVEAAIASVLAAPCDAAPVLAVDVVRRGGAGWVVVVAMHELVADGAALELFVADVLASYAELGFARAAPMMRAEVIDPARLAYWRAQLRDVPPLQFPIDRPRPAVKTHHTAAVRASLDPDAWASLGAIEHALLTGFAALVARYTGQLDYAIGVPLPREVDREAIGPVASIAPLRIDASGRPSFTALARRCAVGHRAAIQHALPFAALVEALSPPRDLSRTPLFQVAFEYRDHRTPLIVNDVIAQPCAMPAATAVDLTLVATHLGDELVLQLAYNTDLCSAAFAQRMLGHLSALLTAAQAAPDRPLADLALLSDDERGQLATWNTTAPYPHDRCLHDWVADQARRTPAAIAVRCGDDALRFDELERRANQLAHRLRNLGLPLEGRVALSFDRSTAAIVALLATLKAGGAYVPLDPDHPPQRLRALLADSGAHVIIAPRAIAERHELLGARCICIDDDPALARLPTTPPAVAVTPAHLAYLIYTSGSTGQPKAVMVSHRGVVNNIAWRQRTWPLSPEDRVLHNHAFSFDPSVWATFWPLVTGAELVVTPPGAAFDVPTLLKIITQHRITVYGGVPSFHALLAEHATAGQLAGLRYILSGGEALSAEVQRAVFSRSPAVLANLYGPTEATIDATMWTCPRSDAPSAAPIGPPIANMTAHVLDDRMAPVPLGVAGELYLGGPGVARGYHDRPALTAERFVPDPFTAAPGARLYRTGDLVLRRDDGALVFLGRVDDQIKVRGFRIELGELEARLREHPGVLDAVALAVADAAGERRLVGYVSAAAGVTGAAIVAGLAELLPAYMVPWQVVVLDELPKNHHGKLDRKALAQRPVIESVAPTLVAPRNRLEEEIAETFISVLGVRVGIHDDFFEAGGTSLMLARAATRLVARFQMEIPIHEFFRVPTVAGVAEVVDLYQREGLAAIVSRRHAEHLDADATLAPEIRADGLPVGQLTDPRAVLVTGATGYLGSFLVEQLLRRTRAKVYCLVRAPDEAHAMQRLRDVMVTYRIWDDRFASRIVALPGDLAKLRLGQDDARWDALARELDAIYHSGALVNFVYPYSALRTANVRGTEEVLRLACTHQLKAVHHVSTIDVLLAMHADRPFLEDDAPLRSSVQVPAGYTGSKWVAEKVVHLAQQRGLPVAIYRPGLILSHEDTGATQTNDYLLVALRGFMPMGILPSYPRIFDAVPVDYVAKAIVHISTQPAAHGKFFHLFNPAPVSIDRFYDWIRSYGYRFDVVDFEIARRRALEVEAGHPLYPLVPLIRDAEAAPQPSLDPAFIDDLQPEIEAAQTLALLAGSGIRCPAMTEALAHNCLRYLIDVGFLPPPLTASHP